MPTSPIRMKPADRRIGPVVELRASTRSVPALVGQADEEEADRDREDTAAEVVEVRVRPRSLDRRQEPPDDEQADEPDRDVDVEDPVPADVVGQEAAESRARR